MTVIFEDLDLPGLPGGPPWPAEVRIRLAGAQGRPILGKTISTNKAIVGELLLSTDNGGISASGYWSVDLHPNSDILPSGTTYLVTRKVGCNEFSSYLSVPITGGPYEAFTQEDDPVGEITPSALSAHASDLLLHGGGIQYDYKYIDTATVVTGSGGGLTLAPLTGTMVTVPDVGRGVWLQAHIPVKQQPGGPTDQSWGLFKTTSGYGAFSALDAVTPASLGTVSSRHADLWAFLPAHSQGNYVVAATGQSGNLTAKADASAIQKGWLRVFSV